MLENVSVITTSYNDSKNCINYLDSIIHQSEYPKEIIIVDGGSEDDTVNLIMEYAKTSAIKIKLFYGEHLNIAQGFNKAILNASTTYVIITCIGNLFSQEMVYEMFKCINNSNGDIGFCILKGIDKNNFSQLYNNAFVGGKKGIPLASNRCVILNRNIFDKIGFFKENFIYAGEDAEFFYRARKAKLNFSFTNKILLHWETPDSWKKYLKQIRLYSIGELQWAKIMPQLINIPGIFVIILLIMVVISIFSIYGLILFFILFSMGILLIVIKKRISINAALLCLSYYGIRFYYKIKLVKYIMGYKIK